MTDKPQIALEEIELIPHPMDAWRAALDVVIACAPGDESAIAWHLADAQAKLTNCLDRTPATAGTRQLVDRLMLIGAGRLISDRLSTEASRTNGKCVLTPAGASCLLTTVSRAQNLGVLTEQEAEIISQDLIAGVRQHRAEPLSSPSSCAATAAQNGQCTSHPGQRTAHQCAVVAPLPNIEPAPQEQPALPPSPSRAAHVAQRFLAVDPDRS